MDTVDSYINPPAEPPATWRDVVRLGKEDLCAATGRARLAAAATLGLLVYELGPGGNETTTAFIFGQVTERTSSILPGSLITGATTATFVAAEQYIAGKLTIKSLDAFPETAKATFSLLNKRSDDKNPSFKSFHELPTSKRFAYAFAGGTNFTINREHFAVGETDKDKLNALNLSSLEITSACTGTIFGLIDAGKKVIDNDTVDKITGYLLSPLSITGLITAAVIAGAIKSRRQPRQDA